MRSAPRDAGLPLTRADQPDLWHLVDGLAADLGTRSPDEIRLSADGHAGVTRERRITQPRRLHRTLWIGLPLLPGLDVEQLRGVLAHEIAHLGLHSGWVTRQLESSLAVLARFVQVTEPVPLLGLLVRSLAVGWVLLVAPRLRAQELEADAAAARVLGTATVASAVTRSHAVADHWQGYVRSIVWPVVKAGAVPADVLGGFRAHLATPQWARMARATRHEEATSRLATHPSVPARLQALAALLTGPPRRPAPRAITLLRDVGRIERAAPDLLLTGSPIRQWLPDGVRGADLPRVTWDEAAAWKVRDAVAREAQSLRDAVSAMDGGRPADLARVLDAYEQGHAKALQRAVLARAHQRGSIHAVGLEAVVAEALETAGHSPWVWTWDRYTQLGIRGSDVPVRELVEAAGRSPDGVPALRAALAELGVDSTGSARTTAAPALAPPAEPAPAAPAAPALRLPRQVRDVTVGGLLTLSTVALVATVAATLTVPFDLGNRSAVDEARLVVGLGLLALLARAAGLRVLALTMPGGRAAA